MRFREELMNDTTVLDPADPTAAGPNDPNGQRRKRKRANMTSRSLQARSSTHAIELSSLGLLLAFAGSACAADVETPGENDSVFNAAAVDEDIDGPPQTIGVAQAALQSGDFMPHNQQQTITVGIAWGICSFNVQHGNYLGAAYAKVRIITPGCYAWARLTGARDGRLLTTPWTDRADGPIDDRSGTGPWKQAQQNGRSIVGSEYVITKGDFSYYYNFGALR